MTLHKANYKKVKVLTETFKNLLRRSERLKEFESIGTVEEFKTLKEKNTPMELAEHNFQDEVHHYLCPSCRCIMSYTQNYCEWCGQALET